MKVRIQFLQGAATDERIWKRGDIAEWDSIEAERFQAAGIAKILESLPPLENTIRNDKQFDKFKHKSKGR